MEHKCHKEEIITDIKKAINGNGQPGLKETVYKLNESVSGLNKRLDRMDQKGQFNITTVISIGALIVAIVAILLT